jgi:galactokinase
VVDPETLAREFTSAFGRAPQIYRAPGRVNLIGEHTDYNDGFVMPMALDRLTWVAAAPRRDRHIVVHSREYAETVTIALDAGSAGPTGRWSDYVRGIGILLDSSGADMLIASDVPIGAGLSSSAALEVACGFALADIAGCPLDLNALARIAQRAEHEFAGTRCGIMDQMIACHGRAGHALLIDTRSLDRTSVPVPPSLCVVVCNTMVRHALASNEYNARRADCEAGVRALAARFPGVQALRDATLEQLGAIRDDVSMRVVRRCRHVIAENDRVLRAAAALGADDFSAVGALMAASHASLRDEYEASCAELDTMASIVAGLDGVLGARMTGGGFGGCVVALAEASAVDADFRRRVRERYEAQTGLCPDVWVCAAGDGVGRFTSVCSSATPLP